MANRADITPEICRQLLRYESETGKLFWLPRPIEMFNDGKVSSRRGWRSWNAAYAGKEALYTTRPGGYRYGTLMKVTVMAHRVAWLLVHGRWPTNIDHINGDRCDNRLDNLREVTIAENNLNIKARDNSPIGVPGVRFYERHGKWIASITKSGKTEFLGYHCNVEDAIKARKAAELRLGFHPMHATQAARPRHK